MPGLIGKKIGMTSVFSADGKNVPCTVVEVGPCVVTQIKTVEKDGYDALQLGFEDTWPSSMDLLRSTIWATRSQLNCSPRRISWTLSVRQREKDSKA